MCAVRYAGTLLSGGAVEFPVEDGLIVSVHSIKDSAGLPWIMPVPGIRLPEIKVGEEASFVIVREGEQEAIIDRTVFMGREYSFGVK